MHCTQESTPLVKLLLLTGKFSVTCIKKQLIIDLNFFI
jgi:hypothetical protein